MPKTKPKPIEYDDGSLTITLSVPHAHLFGEWELGDHIHVVADAHVSSVNFTDGDQVTRKHTAKGSRVELLDAGVGQLVLALANDGATDGRLFPEDGERYNAARLALAARLEDEANAEDLIDAEEGDIPRDIIDTATAVIDLEETADDVAAYWDTYAELMTRAAAEALAGIEYARRRRGAHLDQAAKDRAAAMADQADADEDGNVPTPSEVAELTGDKPSLTKAMVDAIDLITNEAEDGRTFRVSNKTHLQDDGEVAIYWQTSDRLKAAGLADQAAGSHLVLTDAGIAVIESQDAGS